LGEYGGKVCFSFQRLKTSLRKIDSAIKNTAASIYPHKLQSLFAAVCSVFCFYRRLLRQFSRLSPRLRKNTVVRPFHLLWQGCKFFSCGNARKYGARVFHANDKTLWNYANKFAEFNNCIIRPLRVIKMSCTICRLI
jgi:hypothetical protein